MNLASREEKFLSLPDKIFGKTGQICTAIHQLF